MYQIKRLVFFNEFQYVPNEKIGVFLMNFDVFMSFDVFLVKLMVIVFKVRALNKEKFKYNVVDERNDREG